MISCASNDRNMENRKWFLVGIEGETDIFIIDGKKPYIEFDLDSSKVGGNATCNNFFTDYHIEGNSIKLGVIATTLMVCVDDSKQEYRFLQALRRVDSFKMEEEKLFLFEGEHEILIFISQL